ncbi:MAG: glycerol-3-phosphate 1-O-acyltransferase PlsY [Fimbriimonadales bacterium]|nr:glycerol-3-phosphate 1-O-acyltransferase PlsY [Fimbriimonadales bacterium]
MTSLFLYAGIAFFFGSIPVGYLLARIKKTDIRRLGSGNIGATNVYRTLGAGLGILTFALDFAKGFLPTYLTLYASPFHEASYGLLVGTFAVIGHMFSPFLAFKGGRGVATGLGVVLAATPPVAGVALLLWLPLLLITRYMSLASLIGAWSTPVAAYILSYDPEVVLWYLLICILITLKHAPNISRLIQGTENRFHFISSRAHEGREELPEEDQKERG